MSLARRPIAYVSALLFALLLALALSPSAFAQTQEDANVSNTTSTVFAFASDGESVFESDHVFTFQRSFSRD